MIYLILGLALFVVGHLFTTMRSTRQGVIDKWGEMPYKAAYSVVSIAGIGLIVLGMRTMEPVVLWATPAWAHKVTGLLMIPAFILVACNKAPTNIKRVTRHPMLWGVVFWGGAHLLSNGKLSSLLLFGTMAGYSLLAMWLIDQRGKPALPAKLPISKDAIPVVLGLVLFGAVRYFHP